MAERSGALASRLSTVMVDVSIGSAAERTPPTERTLPVDEIATTCALCGEEQGSGVFRVNGSLIVRCIRCDLVRAATRPRSPHLVYTAEYYASARRKGGYANYVLDARINELTFKRRLRDIERRLGRRGRLLDVGCALGDFLVVARDAGWQAEGVEISSFASKVAASKGVVTYCGVLEDLRLPANQYDVITLYDTIEHLVDPLRTLREIKRLLASDGIVHIVTPDVGGLQARLLGPLWYHFKPGEHLVYFSSATLRAALESAGFLWAGSADAGSYVTISYVFNRLRYYLPRPFGFLESVGRTLRLGPVPFYLHVGEMEAWASRSE